MTVTRTQYEGRTYEVITDEAKRDEPLCDYCQIYRIRKDGKPGRRIVTIATVFAILQTAR